MTHDTCSCSAPTAPCHPIIVLARLPFGAVHLMRHGFACTPGTRARAPAPAAGGRQRPPPAARPPLASQQGSVARHARFGESILLRVFARETLRSQSAVLTRQCVSTRCLDWVSRYRQTGPDRGQPSSAPGPGTGRLELPNSFPPRAGPTCLPAPTDHGEEFLETDPGRQAGTNNKLQSTRRRHHMPTHLPSACAATNGPYLARYIQQGRAGKKKK
jgi:hypothetical protein